MKIANQETIKSIIEPEDKPTVETGNVRENTSLGVASVKSGFESLLGPNDVETMITQNQAETLRSKTLDHIVQPQDKTAKGIVDPEDKQKVRENQAETLKQKPTVDQVLHWLIGPNNVETMITQNQAETLRPKALDQVVQPEDLTARGIIDPQDKPAAVETMITQNQAETLKPKVTENQAETLKPNPSADQVLHWLNKLKG